jgi:hypothetical protein
VVPDIYDVATVENKRRVCLVNKIVDDLKPNAKIKVYALNEDTGTETAKDLTVVKVFNGNTFEIDQDIHEPHVFVYGRYVDDFKTVDKDGIFAIGIAALKELDRQVADLTERLHGYHEVVENSPQFAVYSSSKDILVKGSISLTNGQAFVDLGDLGILSPQYFLQNNSSFDRVKGSIVVNKLLISCENPNSTDTIHYLVVSERTN